MLRLSKIGAVRLGMHRELVGTIKTFTKLYIGDKSWQQGAPKVMGDIAVER